MSRKEFYQLHEKEFVTFHCIMIFPFLLVVMYGLAKIIEMVE